MFYLISIFILQQIQVQSLKKNLLTPLKHKKFFFQVQTFLTQNFSGKKNLEKWEEKFFGSPSIMG